MKRLFRLAALVMLTASAGAAMAGEHNVAVSVGIPGQVYVNAQSAHHPQPSHVQEHRPGAGRSIHPARYESEHGHGQPHHRAASHRQERHVKHDYRDNRHDNRGHGHGGHGDSRRHN